MLRSAIVLLAASVALAGCTGDAAGDDDLAKAANSLDIAATSTTGVIRGVVVDEALRPVAGAAIELAGGTEGATTSNDNGAFGFADLAPGTYFLTISAKAFSTVQQSAEVVAGVSDPQPVRVLLVAVPVLEPFIETLSARIFLTWSGWADGVGGVTVSSLTGEGNYFFTVEISPNGTLAQTELVWDMTSPLGENTLVGGGTYAGDDGIDTESWSGPSPLVMRANATEGDETADSIYYNAYAAPSAGLPTGQHLNQAIDAYVNVFHNFLPNDGWTFASDGAHPLPPP